jgi:invasion protein IalB
MIQLTKNIAAMLTLIGFAATAAAQPAGTPASNSTSEPAWKLVCPQVQTNASAQPCSLIQNLVAGEQQQRLLTVIVQPQAQGSHLLTVALPHGVFFPAGVSVQVDDAPEIKLVVQSSDQNGAYTGTAVDAALLTALQNGKSLKISFTSGSGQRILIPVTLKDFGTGLKELNKRPLPPTPKS